MSNPVDIQKAQEEAVPEDPKLVALREGVVNLEGHPEVEVPPGTDEWAAELAEQRLIGVDRAEPQLDTEETPNEEE